jgi:hypothetical protein
VEISAVGCLVTVSWVMVGQLVNRAFGRKKDLHVSGFTHSWLG